MTITAVCLATLCTIVGNDIHPAMHSVDTRMYVMEQRIHEKIARAVYYQKAVRLILDIELNKLIDLHLMHTINSKLEEVQTAVNHVKKVWRDARFCYEQATHEMKEAASFYFNRTAGPCIQKQKQWIQADLRKVEVLINNFVDGLRQLNVLIPECQANTETAQVRCMERTMDTIETNLDEIHDITNEITDKGVQSFLNSYKAFDNCMTGMNRELFSKAYAITEKAKNCSKSTHRPLCPYSD